MFGNFTEEARKILMLSKKEMYDLKHPYIGSEHLMLAILKGDNEVSKKLKKYNLTYKVFKDEIIRVFDDRYVIIIIGSTISLAGNPRINAISITPSNPSNKPKLFKKLEIIVIILLFPIVIFVSNQIISPVGAAITTALPSILRVLSIRDLTSTFNICGFL